MWCNRWLRSAGLHQNQWTSEAKKKQRAKERINRDGRRGKKRDFDLIYFFLVFVRTREQHHMFFAHESFSVYAEEMIDTSNNSERLWEQHKQIAEYDGDYFYLIFSLLHALQVFSVFEFSFCVCFTYYFCDVLLFRGPARQAATWLDMKQLPTTSLVQTTTTSRMLEIK